MEFDCLICNGHFFVDPTYKHHCPIGLCIKEKHYDFCRTCRDALIRYIRRQYPATVRLRKE